MFFTGLLLCPNFQIILSPTTRIFLYHLFYHAFVVTAPSSFILFFFYFLLLPSTRMDDEAFSVIAPKFWNKLPPSILPALFISLKRV